MAPGQRFEGDHRSTASTSVKATSRTYGCVIFSQDGIVNKFAGSSGTHIDLFIWGGVDRTADVSQTVVRSTLAGPLLFSFSASTAGANPLVPKSPDIDTFVNVRVDYGHSNSLVLTGEVFGDNFPNLEVFLLDYQSQHTALLIDGRTTGGRDTGPTRLIGTHSDHPLGRFFVELPLTSEGLLAGDSTCGVTTLPDYPTIYDLAKDPTVR